MKAIQIVLVGGTLAAVYKLYKNKTSIVAPGNTLASNGSAVAKPLSPAVVQKPAPAQKYPGTIQKEPENPDDVRSNSGNITRATPEKSSSGSRVSRSDSGSSSRRTSESAAPVNKSREVSLGRSSRSITGSTGRSSRSVSISRR